MAYQLQDFMDDEVLFAAQLELMEKGIMDAEAAAEEAKDASKIPFFDLGDMGLAAIDISGGNAQTETDTSEIWDALDKGAVTFGVPIRMGGAIITGQCTLHSFTDGASMHQCIGAFYTEELVFLVITVLPGLLQTAVMPMSGLLPEESPPTEIDLSALESTGRITESFADGSSETSHIEFDAEGKPTKITDSRGNETVLIW